MSQLSEKIFDSTNGGKDIIVSLFPDSEQCFESRKNFSIRSKDNNPSASLKQLENGVWMVREFYLNENFNAISLYGWVKNLDWTDSLKELASIYNINNEKPKAKFGFKKRKAKKGEENGDRYFKYHEKLLPYHLEVFGPITTRNACEIAKVKGCKSYSIVKGGYVLTFEGNKDYPILVYDFGEWQKIYQPKSYDKKYRFSYAGNKPFNYVFGLDELKESRLRLVNEKVENADRENKPLSEEDLNRIKLPIAVISSGDSDGINFLSLGFPTVWLNSENVSANQFKKLFSELKNFAHKVVYVPDIDKVGVRVAEERSVDSIQLFCMYLPNRIQNVKDFRGNKGKDFKDFIKLRFKEQTRHYPIDEISDKKIDGIIDSLRTEVRIMLNNSIRCQFWKTEYKSNGKFSRFKFDYESCIYFLRCSGFFLYKENGVRIFVKREGHVIHKIESDDIRKHLIGFLREGNFSQDLRNFILEKKVISRDSLFIDLPEKEIELTKSGKDFQLLHFKNVTWKVTADNIETINPKDSDFLIWHDEIIQHNVFVKPPELELEFDDELGGLPRIVKYPQNPECNILEYLALTSNMNWQLSLDVEKLPVSQRDNAHHHLLNKVFAIGYLLHRYKRRSKAWGVWLMENEVITNGESHGGTGKSLFVHILTQFQSFIEVNARDRDVLKQWPYNDADKNTAIYWFDDCFKGFDFNHFYPFITGSVGINRKGADKFNIPFEEAGKHIFTSNYAINNSGGSTERRVLFVSMGDYFHSKNEEKGYLKGFTAEDHFKKELFTDFTNQDWNNYFNTMARCIQLYLKFPEKLDPPMLNTKKRGLVATMGENFKDWADDYFGDPEIDGTKFNCYILKKEAYEASPNKSSNQFTKCMKAWCKFYGYDFNPSDVKYYNKKSGYMMKSSSKNEHSNGSRAHLYIKTDIRAKVGSELDDSNDLQ